ncbi:MAG: polysaccharide pyruvyl transferase family protein [Bacteroidales bacterium]|nr:polysaccharide pyruvyl transferase family protein [Bacteroidales bacterium]
MKIGILTLPLHTNYGGILQAWALQTVLERMGNQVEVFGLKEESAIRPILWSKRLVLKILGRYKGPCCIEYIKKSNGVNLKRFVADNIHTREIKGLNFLCSEEYDLIIVGSDQIWRKDYIRGLWKCTDYSDAFLNLEALQIPRISYAASFGLGDWQFDKETTRKIKKALDSYIAISVRENSAKEELWDQLNLEVQNVIDPTLLLNSSLYINKFDIDTNKKSNNLVSYILDDCSEKREIIEILCSKNKLKNKELNRDILKDKKIPVKDWLTSIANAEIIVTDSYHGCIFSIIFRKRLVFIKNMSRGNTRFDTLIDWFGIDNNCVSSKEDLLNKDFALPTDIDVRLDKLMKESMSFLNNSIAKIKE